MQKITTPQLLSQSYDGQKLYAIVDINLYSEPLELHKKLTNLEHRALFLCTPYSEHVTISPKLVELSPNSQPLVGDVLDNLSGCLLTSHLDIEELNQVLGESLVAEHEDNGKVYARFFMPAMARALIQAPGHSHCWRNCTNLWLPSYRKDAWVGFEIDQIDQVRSLVLNRNTDFKVQVEHLMYLFARHKTWAALPIETVKQAMETLTKLNSFEPLSYKVLERWSQWLARHTAIFQHPSWESLINGSTTNNEKWHGAHALEEREVETINV